MRNSEPNFETVPAEVVDLVEDLLREHRIAKPASNAATDYRALFRYLRGELPQEQARAVERRLMDSSPGRARLREARGALNLFPSLLWSEALQRAAEGDALAGAWTALVREQGADLESGWESSLRRSWTEIQRSAGEVPGTVRAVWNVLSAFIEQLRRERQWQASLPAVTKGTKEDGDRRQNPFGRDYQLSARAAEGTLIVSLRVPSLQSGEAANEESEVTLAIRNSLGEISLGTSRIRTGEAEWTVPGLAGELGLPEGPVSASSFAVKWTAQPAKPDAADPAESILAAEIMDEEGPSQTDPILPLHLRGKIVQEKDILSLTVGIDGPTRLAYKDYYLALEYLLLGDTPLLLGAWPLSAWRPAYQTLHIPFPASAGPEPLLYLPLRARLYPADPVKRDVREQNSYEV